MFKNVDTHTYERQMPTYPIGSPLSAKKEIFSQKLFKKYISSTNELLSNNSLFGGQLSRRSNHKREADLSVYN